MGGAGPITFTSLLIGLIAGWLPLSVAVDPGLGARTVVFAIDGREVGRASAPPWTIDVDLGEELRPHRISAAALDGAGRLVARAERRINVPQPAARLEILIERDASGGPVAVQLIATSVLGDRPDRLRLKLDGRSMAVDGEGRAALPKLDLSQVHVLAAVADYSSTAFARAEVAIGGDVSDAAGSRLTAVPIRVRGSKEPGVAEIRGALVGPGGPLSVVAVERGDATVQIIREPINGEAVQRLGRPSRFDDFRIPFDAGDRVGVLWPVPMGTGSVQTNLFEAVGPFSAQDRGYYWLIADVARRGQPFDPPFRFADAVAVGGLMACEAGTRRAVVLVEGAERRDASLYTAAQVQGYLDRIGVPLHIWSLTGVSDSRWTETASENISSLSRLRSAVRRLKEALNAQRIVWVVGDWMPGDVAVSADTKGFELMTVTRTVRRGPV